MLQVSYFALHFVWLYRKYGLQELISIGRGVVSATFGTLQKDANSTLKLPTLVVIYVVFATFGIPPLDPQSRSFVDRGEV